MLDSSRTTTLRQTSLGLPIAHASGLARRSGSSERGQGAGRGREREAEQADVDQPNSGVRTSPPHHPERPCSLRRTSSDAYVGPCSLLQQDAAGLMITTSSSFSRPSLPSSAASLAPAGPLSSRPPPPRRFSELPPVPPTPDRSTFSSNSSTLSLPLSARLLGGSAHMSDSPDPPRKRGPPGPSSAASLTKKGILKHNSSALSLANGSSSGSSSPGRARPVDAHSLAEGVGSTTDATFRTASEGHSTLAATCDDACWTPPIQHGMPAELQLPVPVAAVAPSRRPAPLPAFPPATLASLAPGSTQTFVTAPSTSSSLWPATPPSTASTPTGEPVAGQNTYFIPSPHRRMSERDLAALAARTTRPKDDAAAAAKPFSAGRFALPGFRRRRSEDGPSRDRSASVGGRPPVPLALDPRPLPPLARNDSAGSVGSSACCRGNGAIEGESLSDLVRPDERTTRRRSRTLGTYE